MSVATPSYETKINELVSSSNKPLLALFVLSSDDLSTIHRQIFSATVNEKDLLIFINHAKQLVLQAQQLSRVGFEPNDSDNIDAAEPTDNKHHGDPLNLVRVTTSNYEVVIVPGTFLYTSTTVGTAC